MFVYFRLNLFVLKKLKQYKNNKSNILLFIGLDSFNKKILLYWLLKNILSNKIYKKKKYINNYKIYSYFFCILKANIFFLNKIEKDKNHLFKIIKLNNAKIIKWDKLENIFNSQLIYNYYIIFKLNLKKEKINYLKKYNLKKKEEIELSKNENLIRDSFILFKELLINNKNIKLKIFNYLKISVKKTVEILKNIMRLLNLYLKVLNKRNIINYLSINILKKKIEEKKNKIRRIIRKLKEKKKIEVDLLILIMESWNFPKYIFSDLR